MSRMLRTSFFIYRVEPVIGKQLLFSVAPSQAQRARTRALYRMQAAAAGELQSQQPMKSSHPQQQHRTRPWPGAMLNLRRACAVRPLAREGWPMLLFGRQSDSRLQSRDRGWWCR